MNYAASLKYLDSFYNLEKISERPANRFWNLERMRFLLRLFNHPEKSFFPVLIAGTKGKGSAGFFLESILAASGIRAGFYSSPHLQSPRERIRIGGRMISKRDWAELVSSIRRRLARNSLPSGLGYLTYFEIMTLLAMLAFRCKSVQAGIFEIGMGGRLDATNVLDAKVAIITSIGMDHEKFLGNTLAKIAREKAGIIKPGAHVAVTKQSGAALKVIRKKITAERAFYHPVKGASGLKTGLAGDFQKMNAGAAAEAAKLLRRFYGFPVTAAAIRQGISAREWPGRLESIPGKPSFLLDAAHNPDSIQALAMHLRKHYPSKRLIAVFGTSNDKKSDRMLRSLAGAVKEIIITRAASPRSQQLAVLFGQARGLFSLIYPAGNVRDALRLARQVADRNTVVVVTGSFYLAGEAKDILCGKLD